MPIDPAKAGSVLRIGTTGDYLPFTWWNHASHRYEGFDIDRAEAFARDRTLALTWVRTTWEDLSEGLQAGRYQMAVGGISRTSARAEAALLSNTLDHTGKVALVRCGEEEVYDSLEKIDRIGVRVVENCGGTNEQFARATIKHATLIMLPNNFSPFAYLKDRRADVMFTDSIEARFRQGRHRGLCAVRPEHPYTSVETVFLFGKGEAALRDAFNHWLASDARRGAVGAQSK